MFVRVMCFLTSLVFFAINTVYASSIIIPMYLVNVDGQGKNIGNVEAESTPWGVLFTPHLRGLSPGPHGFHIHENPTCLNSGMAAGNHLDPNNTDKHEGPFDKSGHLGDLPVLFVEDDRTANIPLLAPRIRMSMLKGHALIIHEGSDNYSDKPEKNGGGGERIACGVIN